MKKKYIDWVNKLTKALWGITFEEAVQEANSYQLPQEWAFGFYMEGSIDSIEEELPGFQAFYTRVFSFDYPPTRILHKDQQGQLTILPLSSYQNDHTGSWCFCTYGDNTSAVGLVEIKNDGGEVSININLN